MIAAIARIVRRRFSIGARFVSTRSPPRPRLGGHDRWLLPHGHRRKACCPFAAMFAAAFRHRHRHAGGRGCARRSASRRRRAVVLIVTNGLQGRRPCHAPRAVARRAATMSSRRSAVTRAAAAIHARRARRAHRGTRRRALVARSRGSFLLGFIAFQRRRRCLHAGSASRRRRSSSRRLSPSSLTVGAAHNRRCPCCLAPLGARRVHAQLDRQRPTGRRSSQAARQQMFFVVLFVLAGRDAAIQANFGAVSVDPASRSRSSPA